MMINFAQRQMGGEKKVPFKCVKKIQFFLNTLISLFLRITLKQIAQSKVILAWPQNLKALLLLCISWQLQD